MIQMNNAQERFDRKLFMLCFVKRIWIVIIAALLGAIAGGAIYFVNTVMHAKGIMYESEMVFFVDYAIKPNGEIQYAYNDAGWSYVMMFDEVLDTVQENLDISVTKEELREMLTTNNESDYKILSVKARADEKELCKKLLEAVIPAMEQYVEKSVHMDKITVAIEPMEAKPVIIDYYTERAAALGAVLLVLPTLFLLAFRILFNDCVYVASVFEARYSIPVLGTILHNTEVFDTEELNSNFEYFTQNKKMITVRADEAIDVARLREYDGVLLEVDAVNISGKRIEKTLSWLSKQDCKITGAILVNADQWITKHYYRTNSFRK